MSDDQVRSQVESLVAALADGVTATADQLRGLTGAQIREVERDQRAPLGTAYRRFLELAGAGAGKFMRGSDVYYPLVLGLGEAARELLAGNGVEFVLAGSDRVFMMHQGYQFAFLRGDGADPEVWWYSEGHGEPAPTALTFTAWLRDLVDHETAAWRRLADS